MYEVVEENQFVAARSFGNSLMSDARGASADDDEGNVRKLPPVRAAAAAARLPVHAAFTVAAQRGIVCRTCFCDKSSFSPTPSSPLSLSRSSLRAHPEKRRRACALMTSGGATRRFAHARISYSAGRHVVAVDGPLSNSTNVALTLPWLVKLTHFSTNILLVEHFGEQLV